MAGAIAVELRDDAGGGFGEERDLRDLKDLKDE